MINQGKLVMIPTQIIAFLDIKIDSKAMTISLTEEKIQKDILKCLDSYQNHHASSLELTKVLGHITSTIEAVLSASLNFRSLQQQ